MGSFIEINDTLQLTRDQGFPVELEFEKHVENNILSTDFQDRVFEFHSKPNIRIYHAPPVRTFLVENIEGKWLYWGLCEVVSVTHDLVNKTTSGKFQITKIFTPNEMKSIYPLVDNREGFNFLGE
jgi:hypothetical protein